MKREDWLDQIPLPPAPGTGDGAYQGWKLVVAAHAEKAGVLWDPEEPELPERISVHKDHPNDAPALVPEGMSWHETTHEQDDAIAEEARRRWHALGKLRKWLEEQKAEAVRCGDSEFRKWGPRFLITKLDSLLREES